MGFLQAKLDAASKKHSQSQTLADFRVPSKLVELETEALRNSRQIITPHCGIGECLRASSHENIQTLDWEQPEVASRKAENKKLVIGFPASPLGEKVIYELREALQGV